MSSGHPGSAPLVGARAPLPGGFAWSPGALVAARAVRGIGTAIMTPTALSIIAVTFEEGADPLVVLTEGLQTAFAACAVLAVIGAAVALLLLRPPRKAPRRRMEPVPATAGGCL